MTPPQQTPERAAIPDALADRTLLPRGGAG